MNSVQDPLSATKCGPGHITLEALLDSPGMTPSPLSESANDSNPCDATNENGLSKPDSTLPVDSSIHQGGVVISSAEHDTQSMEMSETQRLNLLRELCIELLFVLRTQDVNGYFLSIVAVSEHTKDQNSRIGLLELERRLVTTKYKSLNQFKHDVSNLFTVALRHYSTDGLAHAEAQRLATVTSDWFTSLPSTYTLALNTCETPQQSLGDANNTTELSTSFTREASLGILNPDNCGVVSQTERVRSIGEEVGPLRSGSHLLPYGGYREDRRNKVIPYTYLDYGPYYSFAPHFDSGASHCSPEANQLVLSTSWLPARAALLTTSDKATAVDKSDVKTTTTTTTNNNTTTADSDSKDADEITEVMRSEAVLAALRLGDHPLAVSLAVAELEQRATSRVLSDLDAILPGPEVADDCVFGMCLANALTKDSLPDRSVTLAAADNGQTVGNRVGNNENKESVMDLDGSKGYGDQNCRELSESAQDLVHLYRAQYRRLGDTNPSNAINGTTLRPGMEEMSCAHRLATRLVRLSKRARPRDLVHPYAVRRAIGFDPLSVPLPSEDENSVDWCLEDENGIGNEDLM